MAAISRENDPTLAYYSRNACEYASRSNASDMSALYATFEPLLAPGSPILDLGCGGGRDARHLASLGHQVIAMDPCPELLAEAERSTPPELRRRIRYLVGAAPDLPLPDSCCSAIWACASLLHLSRSVMPAAIRECSRILASGGVFLVSVKRGSGEESQDGRWFTYWETQSLTPLADSAGFTVVQSMPSRDERGVDWLQLLLRR